VAQTKHKNILNKIKEISKRETLPTLLKKLDGELKEKAQAIIDTITNNALEHRILQELLIKELIPDIDYGYIEYEDKQGRKKRTTPFLWKAGAEKLCKYIGYKVKVKDTILKEDKVFVTVTLIKGNEEMSDGVGACEIGQGLRGMKEVNTAIKMAKKRGLVDAVLTEFGLSGKFTQDGDIVEEMLSFGEYIKVYEYAEKIGLGEDKKVLKRLHQAQQEGRDPQELIGWLDKVKKFLEEQNQEQNQKQKQEQTKEEI